MRQIIAKRQPTAVDLRMVLTVSKIVNDLERIGDEVKKIAYKAAAARSSDRLARVRYFDTARALDHAMTMLRLALDAFARLDVVAPPRSSTAMPTSTRRSRRSCAS